METKEDAVRGFPLGGAFVDELRNRLKTNRLDVRSVAGKVGIDRTRLHQILSGATPPPGPEVVDRLADVLALGFEDRRWMQWLALRERCDPSARMLLEIYERALMDVWETKDVRSIPQKLGDQLELANFIVANRPVYLRHSTRPVFVRVHDEGGELRESLDDRWIVRVEPAGMHGDAFLDVAKDQVVLVNDKRRCRIGWLRAQKHGDFQLHGDDGKPLTTGRRPAAGGFADRGARLSDKDLGGEILVITKTASHRPYVGDIQALIPASTLEAIERERHERLAKKVQPLLWVEDSKPRE